jgi:VCBS repeat-containing protein
MNTFQSASSTQDFQLSTYALVNESGKIDLYGTSEGLADGTEVNVLISDAQGNSTSLVAVVQNNAFLIENIETGMFIVGELQILSTTDLVSSQTSLTLNFQDGTDPIVIDQAVLENQLMSVLGTAPALEAGTELTLIVRDSLATSITASTIVRADKSYSFDNISTQGLAQGYLILDLAAELGGTAISVTNAFVLELFSNVPNGLDKTLQALEDMPVVIQVADFGYTPSQGFTLTGVKLAQLPAQGTLLLNGMAVQQDQTITRAQLEAGQLTYQGAQDGFGSQYASLGFKVLDSRPTNSEALEVNTISFDVLAVNDAAVIGGDIAANLVETNAVLSTSGTLTVSDIDSPATFVAQTQTAGSNGYGKFSLSANGAWTYTTNTALNELVAGQNYTDSFTARAADGTSQLVTVTITGSNEAPVLNASAVVSLPGVVQDAGAPTSALAGQAVSDLFGLITDADSTDPKGIVVAAVNGYGTLYYSTNNGSTWQAASGIDNGLELHLDGNSRVFFRPLAGWTGTADYAFLYRAWDQSNGVPVGSISLVDRFGADSAYSTAWSKVGVTVTAPDTTAPVFSSGSAVSVPENTSTTAVVYNAQADDGQGADVGISYSLGGADASRFAIDAVTGDVRFLSSPDFEAPADVGANNVYNITVTAQDAANNLATQAVSISVTDVVEAGDTSISLGSMGTLTDPLNIDGRTYYYWNTGKSLLDMTYDNLLDDIFKYDVNGGLNPDVASGPTERYRYADINGVKVALPTAGVQTDENGFVQLTSFGETHWGTMYNAGTAINSGSVYNTKYSDMLAVWDAYNGTGTGFSNDGRSWNPMADSNVRYYWTATPVAADGVPTGSHIRLDMQTGNAVTHADNGGFNVMVEVLSAQAGQQSVIALGGDRGQLINPVQVEGKWFYAWDKSGNGWISGENYGVDHFSADELNALFNRDIFGNLNPKPDMDENFRFATVLDANNAPVKLAIPTYGGMVSADGYASIYAAETNGFRAFGPKTSIYSYPEINTQYDDFAAIVDAGGIPATWVNTYYKTATRFTDMGQVVPDRHLLQINGSLKTTVDWEYGAGNIALEVIKPNVAPVLADTDLSFGAAAVTSLPVGAVGTLVSHLVGGVSDADAGSAKGVAIIDIKAGGTLWYSTNGGATWQAAKDVTTQKALLLGADGDNRVFFQPGANMSGLIDDAITFRAWDRWRGEEGQFLGIDTTVHGGHSPFSAQTDTVSLNVVAGSSAGVGMVGPGMGGSTAPTVSLSSNKTSLMAGETARITFSMDQQVLDLSVQDVSLSGGALSQLARDPLNPLVWTAIYTPQADSTEPSVISLGSGKFSNLLGVFNTDGADANNQISLLTSTVRPTVSVSSAKQSLVSGQTTELVFTLSQVSTDFTVEDIRVVGGSLGALTQSLADPRVWTASFTAGSTANVMQASVSVASGKFSNAAGNQNADGADDDNAVQFTVSAPDTLAPAFTSGSAVSVPENTRTTTVVYDAQANDGKGADVGVHYSLSGADAARFAIDANNGQVRFVASPDFEAPADVGANNVYNITVTATDASGNAAQQAVAITVTDAVDIGQSVISLGSMGSLTSPITVDGRTYYYWNTGKSLENMTYDKLLDGLFKYDINGGQNPDVFGPTETYRFAHINGVKVALPTAGVQTDENGFVAYRGAATNVGTSIDSGNVHNTKYSDVLAVWDAYNGAGTVYNIDGRFWNPSAASNVRYYWTATPTKEDGVVSGGFSGGKHALVDMQTGNVASHADNGNFHVMVEVLSAQAGQQSVIPMGGGLGKLYNPVQVEGKWYYAWDRDGSGSITGGQYSPDGFTADQLDQMFNKDIFGNTNPQGNMNERFRYATLNDSSNVPVKLAIPTYGGQVDHEGFANFYGTQNGNQRTPGAQTAISNFGQINPVYDDFAAIMDAGGVPWANSYYKTATRYTNGGDPVPDQHLLYLNSSLHASTDWNYGAGLIALEVVKPNLAPVLTDTALSFGAAGKNSLPVGAVGKLVSELVGGVTDADATDPKGIAVIDIQAGGTLWYSTNGGSTWQASKDVTSQKALLLGADSDNRVFFQPGAGMSGLVNDAITFRAWDRSRGEEGQFLGINTTVNGGESPFSAQTETVGLNVTAPVVLDLNRDGQLSYSQLHMDVNSDGQMDLTAWAAPQDGVLVWDKRGDGLVHDHSQYAFAQYAGFDGATDLQGLAAAFDVNGDGVFDGRDALYSQFAVWQDLDQDGTSDAGEVRSLADWGINAIGLNSDGVVRTPAAGVEEAGRSTAQMADGTQMLVADAAFAFQTLDTPAADLTATGPQLDLTDFVSRSAAKPVLPADTRVKLFLYDMIQGAKDAPAAAEYFSAEQAHGAMPDSSMPVQSMDLLAEQWMRQTLG